MTVISLRYYHADFDNKVLRNIFEQNKATEFEGVIVTDPENKKTYWRYEVEIKSIEGTHIVGEDSVLKLLVKEKSRIFQSSSATDVGDFLVNTDSRMDSQKILQPTQQAQPTYGDHIRFAAKLTKPKLIEGADGRDFDYEYFLQKDDIFYLADIENVQLIDTKHADSITYFLYSLKKYFMQNIEDLLPSPHAFLATGLVISGKGSLDKELQTQFQKVGLIHIVVLSGSNVSIVGEAISKFFSFLPKLWGGIFGSIGIILFGIMTGGGATVYRSVTMSIIGIYARLTQRKNSAFMSLMLAGSLMLFQNPKLLLHDPSFQLSFMATLGLIFLGSPIEEILQKTKSTIEVINPVFSMSLKLIPQSLISLMATTIATQIFTLPFIIRFSGVVSLVALPVNMVILPFIPITMLFVFLSGVMSFISPIIASLPAFVSWLLLSYELSVVHYFSSLSFAAIKLPPISFFVFCILYFIIALLTISLNSKNIFSKKDSLGSDLSVSPKINTTPV